MKKGINFCYGVLVHHKEASQVFCVGFNTSLIKRKNKGKVLMFFRSGQKTWKVLGRVVNLSEKTVEITYQDPIHETSQDVELEI